MFLFVSGQVEQVSSAFTPTPVQIAKARRVAAALSDAHQQGVGAVSLDGQMIDQALAVAAQRVLSRAAGGR